MSINKKRKLSVGDSDVSDVWWGSVVNSVPCNNNNVYTIGNEIHFTCGITKDSIQEIIRQISQLINDHKKKSTSPGKLDIVYVVDSPGGSVTSVLKFVDFINLVREKHPYIEFTSIITGMVASAGTIMSLAADHRYMTKNAHAMIHELSTGNNGKYSDFVSYMKHLKNLHEKLLNIYCEKSKNTREYVTILLKDETWFTADEYLQHGFVQKIK